MAGNNFTVLKIDEKNVTTELERAGYRSIGVSIRNANTFQDAMDLLGKGTYDALILNHDYQQIDAFLICSYLKQQPITSVLPIIITSVESTAKNQKAALSAGADLFIEQPIPKQDFVEQLKKLLEQQTRSNNRVHINGQANISWDHEKFTLPIADISNTGILLSTTKEFSSGVAVHLQFALPESSTDLKVEGEVVRTIPADVNQPDRPFGVGIRFTAFSGQAEQIIKEFTASHADENKRLKYYL
jgi:response regulator RpfG family c-di-GMP phosphodiesterase